MTSERTTRQKRIDPRLRGGRLDGRAFQRLRTWRVTSWRPPRGSRQMRLGPFDVTEDQIADTWTRFTPMVNRLLQVEADRNRMRGSALSFTEVEHIPDEGVDFELRGAPETDWLPAGDSAWQFKRGDYEPAECAKEFAGAAGLMRS